MRIVPPPVPPVFHLVKSKTLMNSCLFHLFHLILTIGLPLARLGKSRGGRGGLSRELSYIVFQVEQVEQTCFR